MLSSFTFLLLVVGAVSQSIPQEQIGAFTPKQFSSPATINGVYTDRVGATCTCSNLISQGEFSVDEYVTDVTCLEPYARYQMTNIGAVPLKRRTITARLCTALDIRQANASIAYQANLITATVRQLLSGWDDFCDGAKDFFSNGCSDCASKDDIKRLEGDLSNTNSRVNDISGNITQFAETMKFFQGNLTAIVSTQDVVNQGFNSLIRKTIADANTTAYALSLTNSAVKELGKSTDAAFARVYDIYANLTNDINMQFAAATAADKALGARIAEVYQQMTRMGNQTTAELQNLLYQLQKSNDNFNVFLNDYWNKQIRRKQRQLLTKRYYDDLDRMPPGFIAMTSGGLRPEDEFTPEDNRITYENVIINYVETAVGIGQFARIVNWNVGIYADADYAIDNTPPFQQIFSILNTIGPAGCVRSYVGTINNQLMTESPQYSNGLPCRYWIEFEQNTCAAVNTTFAWSQAQNGLDPHSQDGLLRTSYCSGPVTTTKTVIRSFVDLQRFFIENICNANMWALTDPNYQIWFRLSQLVGYIPSFGQLAVCSLPLQTPSNVMPSLYHFFIDGMKYAYEMFRGNVLAAEMRKFGRKPKGVVFNHEDFPDSPVQYDTNGNLIADGGAERLCDTSIWSQVSTETVQVYEVRPLTDIPIFKHVSIDTFLPASNFTPDYVQDSIQSDVRLTSDVSHLLPSTFIMFGDPTLGDDHVFDVPDAIATISPDPRAQAISGSLTTGMMPPGTVSSWGLDQLLGYIGGMYTPSNTWIQLNSFRVDKGFDVEAYPYCSTPPAVPTGYNATFLSQPGAGLVPNSQLCTILGAFKVSKVRRNNRDELHLGLRNWQYEFDVFTTSGKIKTRIDSSCPSTSVIAVNTSFVRLTLANELSVPNTIVVRTSSTSLTEVEACNQQFVVVGPPAPAQKTIDLPACQSMEVTVHRITVDPNTQQQKTVQCGSVITTNAIDAAITNFVGIDPTVFNTIVNTTDTLDGKLQSVAATSYLISTTIDLAILQLLGANDEMIKSLRKSIDDVLSTNYTTFVVPSGKPYDSSVLAVAIQYLQSSQDQLDNIRPVNQSQLAAVNDAVQLFSQQVSDLVAANYGGQLQALIDVFGNPNNTLKSIDWDPQNVHYSGNSLWSALSSVVTIYGSAAENGFEFIARTGEAGGKALLVVAEKAAALAETGIAGAAKFLDGTISGFFKAIGSLLGDALQWIIWLIGAAIMLAVISPLIYVVYQLWKRVKVLEELAGIRPRDEKSTSSVEMGSGPRHSQYTEVDTKGM